MRKKAEKGHVCICVAAWQDSDSTYQMLPSSRPQEQLVFIVGYQGGECGGGGGG